MAGNAPAIAPISSTTGSNGQVTHTFEQWNPQQWFDVNAWTLTGTQADSNYKAGLWWSYAQDMKASTDALMKHATSWETGRGQLVDAQQKTRTARAELAGYSGASAKANSAALDNLDSALTARMQSVEPIPAALRNTAAIINDGYNKMQVLWDKWEQDLANAPQCDADVQQMQPVISNMAQSMLDSANAMMVAYHTELAPPTVTNAPPTVQNADSSGSNADSTAVPAANSTASPATISSVSSAAKAGAAPGTVVTPAGAHIQGVSLAGSGSSTIAPTTHVAAPAALHTTPAGGIGSGTTGSIVPAAASLSPTAAGSTPTLAGMGAGTLAPPSAPTTAGAPSGLAGSSGSISGTMPATGIGGGLPAGMAAGAGGFAPFAPTVGGSGSGSRRQREDQRSDRSGTVMPMSPGAGAAGATRKPGTIRPGVAKRTGSAEAAGVAGGLRGRTGESGAPGSIKRRVSNSRRSRAEDSATVQFLDQILDEDAWLTEDAGSGVVGAKPTDDRPDPTSTAS